MFYANVTGIALSSAPSRLEGTSYEVWPTGSSFTITATVLYAFILLAGAIGNSSIIATVLRWREMRTPCNLLIMNIAVADLAVAVIAAPLRILELHYDWPFGEFMCRFLVPLQEVFVCASVAAHTTIALERYRAIVKPMMGKISIRITTVISCVEWFICYIAAGIPLAVLSHIKRINGRTFCTLSFPSIIFRQLYEIYLVVVYIVVPISIQTWAYLQMSRVVSEDIFHTFRRNGNSAQRRSSCSAEEARLHRRNNLIKMLIILVVVFQVCYIPRGIVMLTREFADVTNTSGFKYADMMALILYYVKHVLNPLIIFLTSSDFRSYLRLRPVLGMAKRRRLNNATKRIAAKNAREAKIELVTKNIS